MWTTSEHLLAAVVDLLGGIQWMYYESHRDENSPKMQPPTPVPRPGIDDAPAVEDAPAISLDLMGAWLSA